MDNILKCINCNEKLGDFAYYKKVQKCQSCSHITHGKTLKIYKCIDCNKKISISSGASGEQRCSSCAQKGQLNNHFKKIGSIRFDKKTGYGYIKITNKLWKLVHRFIVEKYIKRKLKSTEIVHHIDGNSSNNTLTNLYLFKNKGHHSYLEILIKHKIINKDAIKSNLRRIK